VSDRGWLIVAALAFWMLSSGGEVVAPSGPLQVVILYDKQGANERFDDVLYSPDVESYLNGKCTPTGWHRWDDQQNVDGQTPEWKAIYAKCQASWKGEPIFCFVRGSSVTVQPLPDAVPAALETLKRYGG